MTLQEALDSIIEYAESRGIAVNRNSNSFAHVRSDSTITCPKNSKLNLSYLVSLLHEVGHAIQPDSHFQSLRKSKTTTLALILEQEYQAWYIGLEVAKELHLPEALREEFITEYISQWSRYWVRYIRELNKYTANELNHQRSAYID